MATLRAALAETEVRGLVTNLPFLRWLAAHPVVAAGAATTSFLTEYPPLSAPPAALPAGPWREAFRLNVPPPVWAASPTIEAVKDDVLVGGQNTVTAPMPGTS